MQVVRNAVEDQDNNLAGVAKFNANTEERYFKTLSVTSLTYIFVQWNKDSRTVEELRRTFLTEPAQLYSLTQTIDWRPRYQTAVSLFTYITNWLKVGIG